MAPHTEILRLARSGSPERAWALFIDRGYDAREDDPAILTLKGRLLKDRARRESGAQQAATYCEAGEAYAAAARISPASYPLINAATLALLSGSEDKARRHAREVLTLIERHADEPETEYWSLATKAEALLLLGRLEEAQTALAQAIAKVPEAWEDHAATIGQFALILAARTEPAGWLDRYRPPGSLHFQGIMGIAPGDREIAARIDEAVDALAPGFGFGALAAGADILIAEALIRRGARLHVVLPCDPADFRRQSVIAIDAAWGPRFDKLVAEAESVEALGRGPVSRPAVAICEEGAMGRALINARLLQSRASALVVHDGSGGSASLTNWAQSGYALTELAADRSVKIPELPGWSAGRTVALAYLPEAAGELGMGHLWSEPADGGTVAAFDEPVRAARVAADLGKTATEGLAIDYTVETPDQSRRRLVERVSALARGTPAGAVTASGAMAWALALHCPEIHAEPSGEMRWAGGHTLTYGIERAR